MISIACSLKNSQKFFIQSSLLHTLCLFFIPLNICKEYVHLFCYRWFFRIIFTHIYYFNEGLKICIINIWHLIRFQALPQLWYLKVFRRYCNTTKIFIFAYFYMRFKLVFCSERVMTIETIKIAVMFRNYSSQKCRQFSYCEIMPSFSIRNH